MQVLRMTVNDDAFPPLVYTIQGKNSSLKLEVRSILYGYLNFQVNEPRYQETWEEFLDLTCQDLMDIVMETTDISYEECFDHFIKVRRICCLLRKKYLKQYVIWE